MRRLILTLIALSLISIDIIAQRPGISIKGNIVLSVKDSISNTPLVLVTAVLSKVDKNKIKEIFTYAVSDTLGIIRFNSIPVGEFEISLQYMGYYMKLIPNIKIDGRKILNGDAITDLGTTYLKENATELNAVTLKESVTPIKYLGDTIQYNAAAYKLSDNDVLEDFFKKLPGWSVDKNGRITANGKVIEQITVNGRIFFLNDPVFVSRNLPAKILKNIKLFEKQSEKSIYTGIDDGVRKNTVDVAIKEEMLNGWLGNINAGGGSEERYSSKGFVANFNKYNQIALIENISNLNESSILSNTLQTNSKDSRNYSLGGNLNMNTKKNNYSYDLSYKLSGNDNISETETYRLNNIKDSSFITNSLTKREGHTVSNGFNGIITKNDKKSLILIKPKVFYSFGDYSNSTKYTTTGGESGVILKEGESDDSGRRDTESISTDIQVVKRKSKERRTLSINGSFSFDRSVNEGRNRIYDISNQKYNSNNNSVSASAFISYTEPFGKKMVLGSNYGLTTSFSSLKKETYNSDNNGNFINLDTLLSDKSNNTEIRQNIDIFIQKPKGKGETCYYNIGISLLPSYLKRSSDEQNIDKWFINIVPKAELRITTAKLFQFFIKYNANSRTPRLTQMIPVPDNTNPLLFKVGNKDLKSECEHNIDLSINQITRISNGQASGLIINTNYSYFVNRIIDKSWFDETGLQYSMPFNATGDYSINTRIIYQKPFFKGRLIISNTSSMGYNNNISYIEGNKNATKRCVIGEILTFNFNLGELNLNTGFSFNYERSENSVNPDNINKTWRNSIEGSIRYLLPFDIDFRTDLSYQYFNGYTSKNDKPYLLWNAGVSRSLIRNKLIFKISAQDILNQNKNIQRSVTDFYIQETRYNIIRQYFIVTMTYKFFTGGKSGAFRERVNSIERSQERNLQNF